MVGSLINRALWVLTNSLNSALKEEGIDLQYSQYVVMRALYLGEGKSQNEIATLLRKDAAAIKRSIDYLETKGFAERRPLSGCKYGVYLTDHGKEMKTKIIAIADEVTKKALSGISDETFQQGMIFLQTIVDSATKEKGK
ncbi:MAG: hypothetical protein LUD00_13300 [Prevotellaceae bacterium]|nr:hypothetical protein [Prevotellaceae bacterium]